jgi:hypothetical protein
MYLLTGLQPTLLVIKDEIILLLRNIHDEVICYFMVGLSVLMGISRC